MGFLRYTKPLPSGSPLIAATLLATFLLLGGCQRMLVPTPNVYATAPGDAFNAVPERYRTTEPAILYVTDRLPAEAGDDRLRYGYRRSRSLAWGECTVEFGQDLSWDELETLSVTPSRPRAVPLRVGAISERGRFPSVPLPVARDGDVLTVRADAIAEQQAAEEALRREVGRRLEGSSVKEVFITIHGFKNSFDDGVLRAAELWHFLGRRGVIIAYTWPAGYPGLLEGYAYDYGSSQFTVFHLQQLIKALVSTPGLDRISLIAHSRGTDVLVSAMRELHLQGDSAVGSRIGQLVLLAPDLDWEVVLQRDVATQAFRIADRTTVYTSTRDSALDFSDFFWSSESRLGKIGYEDLDEAERELLRLDNTVDIVDVRLKWGSYNHSYFESPEVLSDLILLLREDLPAGESGRPLHVIQPGFWILEEGYPRAGGDSP